MLNSFVQLVGRQSLRLGTMGLSSSRSTIKNTAESRLIERTIQENCVVIFSKTTCPFCRMAKKVFHQMETPYYAMELNMVEGGDRIADTLTSMTGVTTVPQVFVNGQCIGGGTETQALYHQGKLAELVASCRPHETTSDS